MNGKQIILSLALSILSFATFASETRLNCPTVNLVSQNWQAMDNAIPDDRDYIVTSKPVIDFSEHLWSLRTVVPAWSQEDAIKLAQITVKGTSALMTPNAIKIFDQYGCVYFSPRAYVYALTQAN